MPHTTMQRFESGIPKLDQILGGGFAEGASYILQGSPGTGKTILANQICFAQAAKGRSCLYMTLLSESFVQMFSFLGSLDFFDMKKVPDYIYYASAYATLRNDGVDALLHLIVNEVRKRRPSLLVFDGLFAIGEYFDTAGRENQFRRFLNELGALAAQNQITVLLVTNSDRRPSSPEYTMVDGWIELVDDLSSHQPRRHLIVHKHRGSAILRGRHEYRLASPGMLVYPRIESTLAASETTEAASGRLTSGVSGLDTMMGGGVPECSTTAIIGPTGSGKTTVGLHFLADATADDPAVFFSFFEQPARLIKKAAGIGLDLRAKIEAGTVKFVWIAPGDNMIDEIGQKILDVVGTTGARRVVIDGLAETGRPLADETRLRSFLRALNAKVVGMGSTIFYTMEVPQLFFPETLAFGQFSGFVDNTLLLHYALSGHAVERRATLLKVRDSDFDHSGRIFQITDAGLVLDQAIDAPAGGVKTSVPPPQQGAANSGGVE
ncbi:RAD55 family ATPase [Jiella mangrovi]|uniref:non-specific serine/threonine protein kinase n=1 Tax=Jiella mangrovi TaxID=2821407 RepID=A0ABS4BDH6_9HYPH|nr:ATPase domain-containing protein [Jiella mangrovi]MBP0614802.1 AAA family ATPase [Jiella mangrovi]